MRESSEHRTRRVYLVPAILFGLVLSAIAIALTLASDNDGFSRVVGAVLGVLCTPMLVLLAWGEVRRGATYLHPRADLIAVAMAAVAVIVGTGVLEG